MKLIGCSIQKLHFFKIVVASPLKGHAIIKRKVCTSLPPLLWGRALLLAIRTAPVQMGVLRYDIPVAASAEGRRGRESNGKKNTQQPDIETTQES